jgi:homopolymeric O-antigen transport system permease protein
VTDLRTPVAEVSSRAEAVERAAQAPSGADLDDRVTVILPARRLPRFDIRELYRYRELFGTLVWRDIKVRYKQTSIGIAWAVLQPFLLMVVMTIVFGKFAQFPSANLPYPVFIYSGLLPWTYFAAALTQAGTSVVSSRNLVTKVYFPRTILPSAAALVPIVDFFLAFTILIGLMVWFGISFSFSIVVAPLFLVLALVTALGVGLWLAAMNVRYRDVPYAVPFLIQMWFWVSPVAYAQSGQTLDKGWQEWVLSLNPMKTVLEGFRWAVVDSPPPATSHMAAGVLVAVLMFVGGLTYFRASEPRFADTI